MKGGISKKPRWKYYGRINGKERVAVWAGSEAEAEEKIRSRWLLSRADVVTEIKPIHVWMQTRDELDFAALKEKVSDPAAPPPANEHDGEVCKAARSLLGWTQLDVYTRTRATLSEVSCLENGRVSAEVRDEVFRAFAAAGVDLTALSAIIRGIHEHRRNASAGSQPRSDGAPEPNHGRTRTLARPEPG